MGDAVAKEVGHYRDKVEKLMVLAKYQRFQSCIEDLDSKR